MIKLLIDSMCNMRDELLQESFVDFVSLNVIIDGKPYRDKKEIDLAQIHDFMRQGIVPTTSQVNPGDFREKFIESAQKGEEVIYLSFSSKMSGSYATAKLVLEEVQKEYQDFKCRIVDSTQSGGGIGLIAEKLIEAIQQGMGLDQLADYANRIKEHVNFFFTVQDLDWLSKGGRISKGVSFIGDLLKIRPIVYVDDGELNIVAKARGDRKAVSIVVDKVMSNIEIDEDTFFDMAFSDPEESKGIIELTKAKLLEYGFKIRDAIPIGTVLAAHLGIKGVGLYYWQQNPKKFLLEN